MMGLLRLMILRVPVFTMLMKENTQTGDRWNSGCLRKEKNAINA